MSWSIERQREYMSRPEVKARLNERRRIRRATDPEYRSVENARKMEGYRKHHEERKAAMRARHAADLVNNRMRQTAGRYGLTVDEYKDMFARQEGRCAVCRQSRKLHVDHCHATGRVRALLCTNCNTALGLLGENRVVIEALAVYIGG